MNKKNIILSVVALMMVILVSYGVNKANQSAVNQDKAATDNSVPQTTKTTTTVNNDLTVGSSQEYDNEEILELKEYKRKINRENYIAKQNAQVKVQTKAQTKTQTTVKHIEDVKIKVIQEVAIKTPIIQEKKNVPAPIVVNIQIPVKKETPAVKSQSSNKYDVEYLTTIENSIITLCNNERAKVSKGSLSNNNTLMTIARFKSNEMLQYGYFAHVSKVTGIAPFDLAKTFGWKSNSFGENIWYMAMDIPNDDNRSAALAFFKANMTAKKIVTDWMNSAGHRANILNDTYNRIGVGVAFSTTGKVYATQSFSN